MELVGDVTVKGSSSILTLALEYVVDDRQKVERLIIVSPLKTLYKK